MHLQVMVALGTNAHCLRERFSPNRQDHELLHCKLVTAQFVGGESAEVVLLQTKTDQSHGQKP